MLLLAACGGSAKTIETPALIRVLRDAGFRNLTVISNKAQLEKLARSLRRPELARDPLDSDTIVMRGYSSLLTMPLTAVRLPSTKAASRRVENDQALLGGKLTEVQVCNVVLSSYNPTHDQVLRHRFRTAVARLRQHC